MTQPKPVSLYSVFRRLFRRLAQPPSRQFSTPRATVSDTVRTQHENRRTAYRRATIYPAQLPERVLNDPHARGEIKVFRTLEKLPEGFHVFYNGSLRSGKFIEAHERPIDFILLHEKWMLCIEVKGGTVRIDEKGDTWQFIPDIRNWKKINPIKQVQIALQKLIRASRDEGVTYWIPDDCCVVFPDTSREQFTNQPCLIQAGLFFAEDLDALPITLPRWLTEKYQKRPHGRAWKQDGAFEDMVQRLAVRFFLKQPHKPPPPHSCSTCHEPVRSKSAKYCTHCGRLLGARENRPSV